MKKKNYFFKIFLMFIVFKINAQQVGTFPCVLDNFIQLEREKNPDYDAQMLEQEKLRDHWKTMNQKSSQSIYSIPVVVHVVWNTATENISDAQIASQILALNTDYMRLNADTVKTPAAFVSISANPRIQFCLAQRDPQGNATNGITRTQTSKTVFNLVYGDTSIWYTSKNGFDGWDPEQYFNIWVADIGPAGGIGFWPGAVFPGHREGVVVNYTFFGTMGSAVVPYNLGRTLTHETGHFLDLHHLCGDVSNNTNCTATDFCNDTPTQVKPSQNSPVFPLTDACTGSSPGLVFMNFMDYPSDSCKNMFTNDQVIRMTACLTGARANLLTSLACTPPSGINEINPLHDLLIFPNPAKTYFTVSAMQLKINVIEIYNSLGQLVQKQLMDQYQETVNIHLDSGVYALKIYSGENFVVRKMIVQ